MTPKSARKLSKVEGKAPVVEEEEEEETTTTTATSSILSQSTSEKIFPGTISGMIWNSP